MGMNYHAEKTDTQIFKKKYRDGFETLISATRLMVTKPVNLTFRIVPGGSHCEASWEKQIPVFMECLGL